MTVMSTVGTNPLGWRIIAVVSIALNIVLLGSGTWFTSDLSPNLPSAVAQTIETPNAIVNFVYFPSQYVNQGVIDPTEPMPTF